MAKCGGRSVYAFRPRPSRQIDMQADVLTWAFLYSFTVWMSHTCRLVELGMLFFAFAEPVL
jgi:hypothetical protein